MYRSIRRVLALVFAICVLAPATMLAQTPEPEPSDTSSAPEVTYISVTEAEAPDDATPAGGMGDVSPVHAIVSVAIDPGAMIPTLSSKRSVVLYIQQGTLRVTPDEGAASISIGTGEPVPYGDEGNMPCDTKSCRLETGQQATLGPGNGLAMNRGSLGMEVVGDERVVLLVSMVAPEGSPDERCWICPTL